LNELLVYYLIVFLTANILLCITPLNTAEGGITVEMQTLFLLIGPDGGGKSRLLRSICAATLLGICGLMVHAESGLIPYFDAIGHHTKAYGSPTDHKRVNKMI
jgi:hypothetical protein